MVRGVKLRSRSSSSMRSRSAVMYTSFKVSITVLTHRRYSTCRASGLVLIAIGLIDAAGPNFSVRCNRLVYVNCPDSSPSLAPRLWITAELPVK
jgi:hypothetical protein